MKKVTAHKVTGAEIDEALNSFFEESEMNLSDLISVNFSSDHKSAVVIYLAEEEIKAAKKVAKK